MKKCSHCGKESPDELSFCPLDHAPLFHTTVTAPDVAVRSRESCPGCGSEAGYTPVVACRRSFSLPLLLTGGLIAIMFRNAARERFVRCNACNQRYGIRPRLSKISLALFWLCLTPAIICAVIFLIGLIRVLSSK